MKKDILLIAILLIFSSFGFSQNLENIDFISPFNDGMAAIQKGDQWGFINEQGIQVIDYRNDLVLRKYKNKSYPVFNNDRCLIKSKKEGISYFGYIDKTGAMVMKPQFLNATHFKDGYAIVLELIKRNVGSNQMLKKPLVSYDYFEALIDTDGNVVHYLIEDPVHITLDKDFLKKVPKITSKMLSKNVIAQLNENKKWIIIKFE